MVKAVIFDVDGTLTERDSWTRLTDNLGGSADEHLYIFKDFLGGKVSYKDSKAKLLKVWQATGNANKENFQKIFESWLLRPEAYEVVDFLKSRGIIVCIITGSMDLYADIVAKRLDIPFYFFNTKLVWDEKNNLIDFQYIKDQAGEKVRQFLQFCQEQNLDPQNCIVVGDGANDIGLFKIARGVALKSADSSSIEPHAWKVVNNLSELREILD
ncbi:MAG: HAD-IB family phosphatase [Parcubacteria group bacterium]|nr:HAD-IB family phosphatase [Parcubacteria group bacterium]